VVSTESLLFFCYNFKLSIFKNKQYIS